MNEIQRKFEQISAQIRQNEVYLFIEEILQAPVLGYFKVWHILLLSVYLLQKLITDIQAQDTCNARHILVKTEEEALKIKKELANEKFETLAKEHSLCPSKKSGGSLGDFSKGDMVKEFNDACFDPKNKVGQVIGPIQTQFGYHLIRIDKRNFINKLKTE